MKYKIFVACKLDDSGIQKLKKQKDFNVVVDPKPSPEEVIRQIKDADAILIKSNVKLPAETLEHAQKLKVICRAGAGVDNIDLKQATKMGIPVTNTPGLNSNSVAEQVFCYINTLYKNIRAYDNSMKAGKWEKGKFPIRELRGKTIGIGGMGAIGRRVLEKAKGYKMKTKVYDPYISSTQAEDMGFEFVNDFTKLLKTCDIVTMHMPSTPETKSLLTASRLASMKENAIFINTARGNLLPPDALEKAMEKHKTLMVGIDVYLNEAPGEKELAKYADRVVMTPHISGNSIDCQLEIADIASDIIINAVTKNKLKNLVNFVKIPEELDQAYLDLAVSMGHVAGTFTKHNGQLEEIRITCNGKLTPHGELLVKPAIMGVLSKMLGENITLINAESKASELGIKTVIRKSADSETLDTSIKVDVVVREKRKAIETSVRGKLTEGKPAIVEINEFLELRIEPEGYRLFFLYDNKPGIIGNIATLLGENNINIERILARNDKENGKRQLLIIKTQQNVASQLLENICKSVETKASTKVYMSNSILFD